MINASANSSLQRERVEKKERQRERGRRTNAGKMANKLKAELGFLLRRADMPSH